MSTSLFSKTPTVTVLDNRGLSVRDIAYHRHPDTPEVTNGRITHYQYDACGFLTQSADPRLHDAGRVNFSYMTDLVGGILRSQGADNGTSVSLNDAAGRPFIAVSNISTTDDGTEDRSLAVTRTWQYEDAELPGRLLSITEQVTGEVSRITERFVYAGNGDAEKACNLAGQCVRHFDTAGLVQTDSIALTGVLLSVTRRLLKDANNPDTVADWQGDDVSAWNDLLDGEAYATLTTADATGAVLTTTDAKGNLQRVAYNVAGLLSGSWLTVKDGAEQVIVKSMTYSAAGQKMREDHGNGVVSTYTYEAETQRLTGITTERPAGHKSGQKVLQDLRYEYDPVGNVLKISNDAEETRFWRNQQVVPENTYVYDSLYQLVSATGREMANTAQQGSNLPTTTVPLPTDSSAYTSYIRTYTYDSGGNLTQVRHSPATSRGYTTKITVSDRSNRGVLSTLTENPSDVDALFTAGGQQTQLQPGQSLIWTPRNELLKVTPVVRDGDVADRESYRYGSGSQRVLKVSVQKTSSSTQTQQVFYLTGLERRVTLNGETEKENLQVITVGEAGRAQVRVLHWENGKPTAIDNDLIRWSYDNLTGSCQLELDRNGNIISMEEYYPYGGTAILTARSKVEADYKTVRYSGKERDATGMYYYGYRYYQPWAGCWLSADPAGTADGLNLFRMVRNSPVTLFDSDGRVPTVHEQKNIDAHARRAGLKPSIQNYQQAFHGIFHAYDEDTYNELWASLNHKIPLNSTDDITLEHMASIADFVKKREIISGMIYSNTTPANMYIDVTPVRLDLHKIPLNVIKKANNLGQYITVTNDNITNNPSRSDFKGVTPRGWDNGQTWESVPGIGAIGKNDSDNPDETVIALSKNAAQEWQIATGHGATSLVLHEYAHAIDRSFGEKANMGDGALGEKGDFLSRRGSFRAAWKADLDGTPSTSSDYYYWQGGSNGGAEEAFAEGFSDIYSNTGKYNWPHIKAYISKKMKSIGTH